VTSPCVLVVSVGLSASNYVALHQCNITPTWTNNNSSVSLWQTETVDNISRLCCSSFASTTMLLQLNIIFLQVKRAVSSLSSLSHYQAGTCTSHLPVGLTHSLLACRPQHWMYSRRPRMQQRDLSVSWDVDITSGVLFDSYTGCPYGHVCCTNNVYYVQNQLRSSSKIHHRPCQHSRCNGNTIRPAIWEYYKLLSA